MNEKAKPSTFTGTDGETVALKSVHIDGRLDGLMLSVKVRQSYRNDSGRNLETVYTFPLAWGATLLGMNVELNGKRMQAAVLEKKEATEKYEKAIDEGDTPVMVEKSAGGLYTANLGNLMTGEEAVIEIEYAQLLHFEQGRIRLSIPTTIAPRFGDAHRQGGLAAHETDSVNPLVEYPFTLKLDVCGQAAKANLSCASHKVSITAIDDGIAVQPWRLTFRSERISQSTRLKRAVCAATNKFRSERISQSTRLALRVSQTTLPRWPVR